MSKGYTVILGTAEALKRAWHLISNAPVGWKLKVEPPTRTSEQNDKMWVLLGELAIGKPDGRSLPPHKWKAIMMDAAGHKPDWERSSDGESMVCVGYKSSRLKVSEMSDVIEAIYEYGARFGVQFSEGHAKAIEASGQDQNGLDAQHESAARKGSPHTSQEPTNG